MVKVVMSKKSQSKGKATQGSRRRLNIIIGATIAVLATAGFGAYFAYSYSSTHQTKTQAYQNLQNISAQMTFPGTLVYEKITDQGCGPNPTTWLSLKDVCTVSLDKFYKASGSAEANLRVADGMVVGGGWQLWNNDPGSRANFERMLREREATGGSYFQPNKPRINLEFFPRDDARVKDETAQQFLGIDQDIPLTGDEYVYGVQVVTGYSK